MAAREVNGKPGVILIPTTQVPQTQVPDNLMYTTAQGNGKTRARKPHHHKNHPNSVPGGQQETIYSISISTVWTGRGTHIPISKHYDYGTIYLGYIYGDEVIFL